MTLVIGGDKRPQPPAFPFDPSLATDGAMLALDDRDRLPRILAWFQAGCLTPDQLNQLLVDWWWKVGYRGRHGNYKLVRMFRFAGFVTDDTSVRPPFDPLVLHRGCTVGHERGFSWSTDRDVAAWFARAAFTATGEARLLTALVPPRHVLGIVGGRNEGEVIVNPFGLRGRITENLDAADASVEIAALQHLIRRAEECPPPGDLEYVDLRRIELQSRIDELMAGA